MSGTLQIEKSKREAEIRSKLPNDIETLLDAAKTDPGAPFEPGAVARLTKLRADDAANWQRARSMLKAIDGVTIGDLDRATAPAGENGDGKQGRPIVWNDPEPCPEPVDGAALLDELADFIRRYVALPAELADTVTLWFVVTWIHDRLEISPFLNVTSATKRCGKSLLLEVSGDFVFRPLPVGGRITAAALFRTIENYAPTLLLDEADTFFSEDAELRGVVNGSQRRSSAYLLRCVPGDDHEPRQFVTWCPKAIAGIGGLPDTVLDRSIVVRLERRPPNVSLERWRDRDKAGIETMRRKLARWISDSGANMVAGLPEVDFPPDLHDRARDAWEPLLAIANEAGGQWAGPEGRALAACRYVAAQSASEETGAREMLLADLRTIFEAEGWPAAIGSKAILDRLHSMEGRRWGEWSRGKPMTGHALARLLKPFGIASRNHRFTEGIQSKAYYMAEIKPAWDAYLPKASQRPNAAKQGVSGDSNPSRPDPSGTDADRTKPNENRGWDVGTLQSSRNRGNGTESAPAPVSLPTQPLGTVRAGDAYRKARDGE